jgi:hypothetical protein
VTSDQTVGARHVLRSLSQVRRQGLDKAMATLEQVEPDLAGYLMEELSLVHQPLFELGGPAQRTRWLVRRTEALVLVCVSAMRLAHGELWAGLSYPAAAEPRDGEDAGAPPREGDDAGRTGTVTDDRP